MDLRSKSTTRLTDTPGGSTPPPSYAPDGSRICFESGSRRQSRRSMSWRRAADRRSASPFPGGQLFDPRLWGRRAATTSAFTKQGPAGPVFPIGIMKPDGFPVSVCSLPAITMKGPTFAPNGRVLMFFRDPGRQCRPVAVLRVDVFRTQRTKGADPGVRRPIRHGRRCCRKRIVRRPLPGAISTIGKLCLLR